MNGYLLQQQWTLKLFLHLGSYVFLIGLAVLGRMGLNSVSSKEGVVSITQMKALMRNVFELYVGVLGSFRQYHWS